MTAPVPLQIHPWPMSPERLELVKRAKASLALPITVQPVHADPGVGGRVLAFGEPPAHVCSAVLIPEEYVGRVEAVTEALRQVLTVPAGVVKTIEPDDYLSVLLGAREITSKLAVDFDGNIDVKGPVAA